MDDLFFFYAAMFCHQIAIGLLILQLVKKKNARGISVKTQELRLLVFLTRYTDHFVRFYSDYHYFYSTVKVLYIVTTAAIVIAIKYMEPFRSVYNFEQDSFPHWKYCVAPSAFLAITTLLVSSSTIPMHSSYFFYIFSLYLEAVAILPQLVCLRKYRLVENLTGKFVLFLGLYRFLYAIYITQTMSTHFVSGVTLAAGCVQTVLYLNFFAEYARASGLCGSCSKRSVDVSVSRRRNRSSSNSNNEQEISVLGRSDEEDEDRFVFELSSAKVDPNAFGRDIGKVQLEPLLLGEEQLHKQSHDLRRRMQDDLNA